MQTPAKPCPDEAVQETIRDIEAGLTQVPLSRAIAHLDAWYERLAHCEREDLRELASELQTLRELLTQPPLEVDAIGGALAQLGEATLNLAGHGDDGEAAASVERLGHLLFHAGHALAVSRAV
jgi:hypothetical protein